MKKTILNLLFLCLSGSFLMAQSPDAARKGQEYKKKIKAEKQKKEQEESLAASITASDLREHLTIIASDEYEGRETGTAGNEKAAQYIADQFKEMGLPAIGANNSYFQPVLFTWTRWEDVGMEINGKTYRHLWDFISFPERNNSQPLIETNEVVFLGYGIDDKKYSDYKGCLLYTSPSPRDS